MPAVQSDLETFLEAINAGTTKTGYEVVFGTGDAEILGLSPDRYRISVVAPCASHEVVICTFDKIELLIAARRVGLSIPRTVSN